MPRILINPLIIEAQGREFGNCNVQIELSPVLF